MNRLDAFLAEHAGGRGPEVAFTIRRDAEGRPSVLRASCLNCPLAEFEFRAHEVLASRRAGVGKRLRQAMA